MPTKNSLKVLCTLILLAWFSPTLADDRVELRKESETRILVMGDSLSAAYYIPPESGWVALLQRRVDEKGLAVNVINSSISGATTAAGLQTLPAMLEKHKPHVVILEMGGNDALQGKPIALITRNLESLIQSSRQAGAEVLLVGMRVPPNLGARYTEPFFQQYALLAKKHELAYVPFLLDGVAGKPELMLQDGIHPKAEAQPAILNNVWPELENVLRDLAGVMR